MEEETTDQNKQPSKNRNLILIGILGVAILIIGGGFFFLSSRDNSSQQTEEVQKSVTELNPDAEVKTFDMSAKQWEFTPSTITVNKGDIVKLSITSIDVTHGFAISDFGINVALEPNTTVTTEFLADKKGTFRFFCSISCGVGHAGMTGTLIVE